MKQFIVQEKDIKKRKTFYSYLHNNFKLKDNCENIIESTFPFVVDFNDNSLWVCSSITCLACASQSKKIISINEFKERMM